MKTLYPDEKIVKKYETFDDLRTEGKEFSLHVKEFD